jgi:hypothetical protein
VDGDDRARLPTVLDPALFPVNRPKMRASRLHHKVGRGVQRPEGLNADGSKAGLITGSALGSSESRSTGKD